MPGDMSSTPRARISCARSRRHGRRGRQPSVIVLLRYLRDTTLVLASLSYLISSTPQHGFLVYQRHLVPSAGLLLGHILVDAFRVVLAHRMRISN
jgi:hypothetical protein